MNLIGITGLKTSGKDTTFEAIQRITGNATRRAFADNLKALGAKALGLEFSDMDDFKEVGLLDVDLDGITEITGRQYLQNLGVGARDVLGVNFWIDQVLPLDSLKRDQIWAGDSGLPEWGVVTDVRFPNEAQRVLDLGGQVWEIVRPGLESDGHASEIPLPREHVTRTILNDGTITQLDGRVEDVLRSHHA